MSEFGDRFGDEFGKMLRAAFGDELSQSFESRLAEPATI